ncbi:hypothetical protein MesoLjLc_52630 [Mesorhizobium sp. L-8-10]|uniref:hypothetical protein n=1 Tax=unclassified Mesorhizobium TaxID=325217 RepID=UPI001925AB62|nr:MULTISPECIES: hypothetical protein [unclassified Mesorhizobium]BCH25324.1 hypothetical protein MesoLjLb_51090 [Mesorhizobium sp. L-8-3]BCH33333.1 hypothetical protein MesoLjLc_52630 [Mesorhizobium sp. L-8-10]
MNIPLERLIEGIVATLRADVIPNVTDGYARGQAVGVIDLLNNIGPRIEWAREPILEAVSEKTALLRSVGELMPEFPSASAGTPPATMSTGALQAERDRLDAAIGDVLCAIHDGCGEGEARRQALGLLKQHIHDDVAREMKLTRKPLFAEIASGTDAKTAR